MDPVVQLIYTTSILCVLFGLYILKKDSEHALRLVFLLLCVTIACTTYISAVIYSAKTKEALASWERINFVAVVVCWAVNLNFYILLTEHKMSVVRYLLLYLPMVALIAADFTVCHIVRDYVRSEGRWKYEYSPMYYAYMLYSLSYCAADMTLVYVWGKRSTTRKYRLQARMILSTMIPLWAVCVVVDYVLSHFAFHKLLPIGPFGRMIYIFVLWYSSVKYRFLSPASSTLLQNIVLNTEEIVVVVDREAHVIIHNDRLDIPNDRRRRKKQRLSDLIEPNPDFTKKLDAILQRETQYTYASLYYRTDVGAIPTSTYLSSVLDNYGDLVGVLLISRKNEGVKEFRGRYKISERQMEIINLILSGLSNAEISSGLRISKKTTETHIFHIYSKLGVENKIELYNLTAGFQLTPAARIGREAENGRPSFHGDADSYKLLKK